MVGDPPDFVQLRLGVDRPPRAVIWVKRMIILAKRMIILMDYFRPAV